MFTKDLDAAADAVRGLVAELDPDAIPMCEVLASWKAFNKIERDAASAKTLLARRVEDGNTWRSAGFRSAAEQLAAIAGSTVTAEKKAIETSRRVRKLPKTAAAMRKGRLSSAKAEAIADAARVAPEAEDRLLDGAEQKSLGELREECLKAKAANVDKARKRIHRERRAGSHTDARRRARSVMRTRPRPQDLRRLVTRRRHRQAVDGPARRSPPPSLPTRFMSVDRAV